MAASFSKQERTWLQVELLETRALLSAVGRKVPIGIAAPTPEAPLLIKAEISPKSEPDGNGVVSTPRVTIVGQTVPGAQVRLTQASGGGIQKITKADAQGNFHFTVSLFKGKASFQVQCWDKAGQTATTNVQVTRGDVLIAWNVTTLNAIRTGKSNPPMAARNLAMVQLAIFDAVNSIDPCSSPYGGIRVRAPRDASMAAAVAGAADEVLNALYPEQSATFAATLKNSLASVPDKRARTYGETVGRRVGDAILALRANDGANLFVNAPPATLPGMWSPTPPSYGLPVGLNFANVTPFAMTSPAQFRPGPPPSLDSAEYTAAYNQVMAYGSINSTVRTADETASARFWADQSGSTFTPPGHWNQIAADAAMSRRMSLPAEARLFAMLDIALADAGISCWNTKNYYDFWRPVTAIRDGNPQTVGDPTWTPLWVTPEFPSYTSGHANFSGAAATVLDSFFGTNFSFSDSGDPTEGLPPRHFSSFDQAAAEAAASRRYGGLHFSFDNATGLIEGKDVAQYVLSHELTPMRMGRK